MTLSRRASAFLLIVAAWTAFVWITLVRNIAKDHGPSHGTAFHLVHYVLAAIALALDVGVTMLGWRGWRACTRTRVLAKATATGGIAAGAGSPDSDRAQV